MANPLLKRLWSHCPILSAKVDACRVSKLIDARSRAIVPAEHHAADLSQAMCCTVHARWALLAFNDRHQHGLVAKATRWA